MSRAGGSKQYRCRGNEIERKVSESCLLGFLLGFSERLARRDNAVTHEGHPLVLMGVKGFRKGHHLWGRRRIHAVSIAYGRRKGFGRYHSPR